MVDYSCAIRRPTRLGDPRAAASSPAARAISGPDARRGNASPSTPGRIDTPSSARSRHGGRARGPGIWENTTDKDRAMCNPCPARWLDKEIPPRGSQAPPPGIGRPCYILPFLSKSRRGYRATWPATRAARTPLRAFRVDSLASPAVGQGERTSARRRYQWSRRGTSARSVIPPAARPRPCPGRRS